MIPVILLTDFTLKQLRQFRGYGQRTIADKLGITKQAYSHKESKKRNWTLLEKEKLAEIFELDMEILEEILKNDK